MKDNGCADVEVTLAKGFEDYDLRKPDNFKLHEAGYDAFVTGYVYAKMFYALNHQEQKELTNSVNIMKSLTYFKHGSISHEEPWFQNVKKFLTKNLFQASCVFPSI